MYQPVIPAVGFLVRAYFEFLLYIHREIWKQSQQPNHGVETDMISPFLLDVPAWPFSLASIQEPMENGLSREYTPGTARLHLYGYTSMITGRIMGFRFVFL